jgi:proteasome lid subunit RPN8/RPN11
MSMFSRRRVSRRAAATVKSIKGELLDSIMEASRHSLPNEFAAGLAARGETISELILIPSTKSNFHSASFNYHLILGSFSSVGTVHSHPSGYIMPSVPDLRLFSSVGKIHIIVGYPFTRDSWAAFGKDGSRIELAVE